MDNYLLEDELAERAHAKKLIVEKWNKYDLLNRFGVTDSWEQLDFALLLENQRLSNEEINAAEVNDIALFRKISIPLVVRIWNGLLTKEIASIQPLFKNEDAFYHLDYNGPQVSMKKVNVTTTPYKYKAVWSFEANQNLKSYYNIDAEAELTAVLAQEIILELDRRSILTMTNYARTNLTWDFNACLGDTIKEKYEGLLGEIFCAADRVEINSGRGKANWIVTSPEVASVFETACIGFEPKYDEYGFTSSLGCHFVGHIANGSFKLYKDPLFPTNKILLGFKGNHSYDSGYFFCPHVLLNQTPTVLDPNSFCPRKGLYGMETYRLAEGGENFYATISIANFII